MKTNPIFFTALCLLSLLSLSACDDAFFGIKGEGPVVQENRPVAAYDEIALSVPAKLYLVQGPKEDIRIEAQQNILNNLETYVDRGTLKIKFDKSVRRHEEIRIYLSTPDISSLHLSGSGEIWAQTPLVTPYLAVHLSGSGKVRLAVTTDELNSTISGSGDIRYGSGTARLHRVSISGSGDVEAQEVQSQTASAHISGSGDVVLWVTEALEAHISGSGNVSYRGTPTVTTHISGSGKVKPI